eukprot:CAMPEP_0116919304 /NCGR_PEP_ID=MMETSP0467-20121206/20301_1 /TAXON_ID=283647 /ORGANISM="Mesodinium pulex, Strain SPMC105" /LENGTH=103 /DNA_ID=CAMNT_0004596847 /DNA_START=1 /DNA_END=312 /DNA_ORIENTATION=+
MSKSSTKLKILCLHGYRQSAKIFRDKTGAFRKKFKSLAEFDFVTAPHPVKSLEDQEVTNPGEQFGWWFSREDGYYKSSHVSELDNGMQESLELIHSHILEHGP